MTWNGGIAMSVRGEALPERKKGGYDASWADANLTRPKNEENSHGRLSFYKWIVNILSNDELINFFENICI
jgi:hypothetical protein